MNVHLIHGIHTDGPSPVQGLIPYLKSYQVKYPEYGWIAGVETRIVNPIIVGTLKPYISSDDILIGHSNGCAIAYELIMMGAVVKGAIFINAALEQNIQRFSWIPWIDVYYNNGDDITEAAKIGAKLGITDMSWGEMGHAGYSGTDPKITNIDCGGTPGLPFVSGHSDFFAPSKIAWWGPFLEKRLQAHLA